MSEGKEGAHGKTQAENLGGPKFTGEEAPLSPLRQKGLAKGPGMSGVEGFFDSDKPSEETPTTSSSEIKLPEKQRELTFRRGSNYYSLDFPVPRTPLEAQSRKAGQLMFDEDLQIDPEDLKWSEKMGKWIPNPKKDNKTTEFGSFIKVLVPQTDKHDNPIRDSKGEIVRRPVWISLSSRAGQKKQSS